MMKKGLIIVPCFNEFHSISIFHKEVSKVINDSHFKIDLLFLNDGSTDKTNEALKELYEKNHNVFYINFHKNYGKNKIIFNSLKYSLEYSFTIFMDVDLQHDPKYITNLIKIWENGQVDMVIGFREVLKKILLLRYLKPFTTKSQCCQKTLRDILILDC